MARKFKVKTRESIGDKIFGALGRVFKRRPAFINLNDGELPAKCIMIGNHDGAGGPFNYRTFMTKRFMTWGAHPMCEGFKNRFNYLYHIFYRQKLGYNKFRAGFMAFVFGIVSKGVYSYAGIIPTYFDLRVYLTYKYSFECLEKDVSVFVLPEDSSEGYKDKIERLHPGFLHLSQLYYKKYETDLPIYTLNYSRKHKKIVIGKPMYYGQLKQSQTDEEILQTFTDYMNSLSEVGIPETKPDLKKAG